MVSLQVLAVILAAFGAISGALMSDNAASPEGALSSPASTIVVKRFQKKHLPVSSLQATPAQEFVEDPLQHALSSFASGSDNPVSAPIPSPTHDSPEPNTLVSAATAHEAEQLVDASVMSDGDDDVSIVDPDNLPQPYDTDLSVHSEPPLEEEWPSAQLAADRTACHTCRIHNLLHCLSLRWGGDRFSLSILRHLCSPRVHCRVGDFVLHPKRDPQLGSITLRDPRACTFILRGTVYVRGPDPHLLPFEPRVLLHQEIPRLGLDLHRGDIMLPTPQKYRDSLRRSKGLFPRLPRLALHRSPVLLYCHRLHFHLARLVDCRLNLGGRPRNFLLSPDPRRQ